jgi:hypothetical protein
MKESHQLVYRATFLVFPPDDVAKTFHLLTSLTALEKRSRSDRHLLLHFSSTHGSIHNACITWTHHKANENGTKHFRILHILTKRKVCLSKTCFVIGCIYSACIQPRRVFLLIYNTDNFILSENIKQCVDATPWRSGH